MTKEQLKNELIASGWQLDSFRLNCLTKTINGAQFRCKLKPKTCRVEVKIQNYKWEIVSINRYSSIYHIAVILCNA